MKFAAADLNEIVIWVSASAMIRCLRRPV